MRVLVPAKGKETWGTMALKAGRWEILWEPHKVEEMHRMNGTFPLASSKEEVLDRVRARVATDQDFAERYKKWCFLRVDLTEIVEVVPP